MSLNRQTRLSYMGHDYSIKDSTAAFHRYRCSVYRSTKCRATLKVNALTGEIAASDEQHTCVSPASTSPNIHDLSEKMFAMAESRALIEHGTPAGRLWDSINQELLSECDDSRSVYIKPKREEIVNFIYNLRRSSTQGDIYARIGDARYAEVGSGDTRLFLNYDFRYKNARKPNETPSLCRMLMWMHPDLAHMLRRRSAAASLDGTFRCVPRQFKQCMILMVYDDETGLYVPIVYTLLQDKTQWTYWHMLHLILVATECKFEPSAITIDFEPALLNAIKEQFPSTARIGCLFHFKQALRRRMVKLRISEDQISIAMRPGMVDRLTSVKQESIPQAIANIRAETDEREQAGKWDEFYRYFFSVWMRQFDFDTWNTSAPERRGIDADNQTNNALENFNRVLNDEFASPHPNLFNFIDVIRGTSERKVRMINEIKAGNARIFRH
jgi:hypothetical protein